MPVFTNKAETKVLYVHVPRTGGTYIETLFKANGFDMALWSTRPKKFGMVCAPQYFHRALYLPLVDLDAFALRFMTVRHPLDRLLSQYRHAHRRRAIGLLDWLDMVDHDLPKNPYLIDNHLRPQHEFIDDSLQVFRQEDRFDSAWARLISDEHGLGFGRFEVPIMRETGKSQRPLTAQETDRLLAVADRFYAADYERFGYQREEAALLRLR